MKLYKLLSEGGGAIAISLLFLIVFLTAPAYGWGRLGHATVALIAEKHLTDSTRMIIDKYLEGKSMAEYGSWMDAVRHTPEYRHTSGWHSASVTEDGKCCLWSEKKARAYYGLDNELKKMANYHEMTDSAVNVGIKLIIHIIGDIHCPSHTVFRGKSQDFEFSILGKSYNFHKFWDSRLLLISRDWSPEYYANFLDVKTKDNDIENCLGTLDGWIEQNAELTAPLYDLFCPDAVYNTSESGCLIERGTRLCDTQILKAGMRLAHTLNLLFDPAYARKYGSILKN